MSLYHAKPMPTLLLPLTNISLSDLTIQNIWIKIPSLIFPLRRRGNERNKMD